MSQLHAALPVTCPAGAPLGTFEVTVTAPGDSTPLTLESINQLLPGYKIEWTPVKISGPEPKKARVTAVLVPADHAKVKVFDAQPADKAATWEIPSRTEIVAIAYGPQGLDKGKVTRLVNKDSEIIGELADYAKKTEQTQTLISAITQQQQALDTGQTVNAAVVGFASQYSTARIDPAQPADQQLATLLRTVNPALSAYDPLSQSPAQRASQSAGLAAAVAGLFFGPDIGLAASGGALLVNMHSVFFPDTEFRSSFAEPVTGQKLQTSLCGNRTPSAARTELAFLWATRAPNADAPGIALKKSEHLPIGGRTQVEVNLKTRDDSLLTRVRDWKLVSPDGKTTAPVGVKVNTETKTLEVAPSSPKLKPGVWKLAGNWDWTPVMVEGEILLKAYSTFEKARLTPESHDRLIASTGKTLADLQGDDFEFVQKLSYKSMDDKFAEPVTLPFHVSKETTLETELDPRSMGAGNYEFLLAQTDGKDHPIPFQVLDSRPEISHLPLIVHTNAGEETLSLEGTNLDRMEGLTSDRTQITVGPEGKTIRVKLDSSVKAGDRISVQMKAQGFDQPISIRNALLVAGPAPKITGVRPSQAADPGIALRKGEIAAGSFVGFALDLANAPALTGVKLSCDGIGGTTIKGRQESATSLFLSFNPTTVGEPGCQIQAQLVTANSGLSLPKDLGTIVRIPHIESFTVGDQKSADNVYTGVLKGQDLDVIERVGWDAATGTPVTAIPAPVAGGASETLEIPVPWPAPAPHAPLYIWLRGETSGRATSAHL